MKPKLTLIVALIIILLMTIFSFFYIKNSPLLSDEAVHYDQIKRLTQNPKTLNPDVTTIPGYHFLLATLAQLFNNSKTSFIRLLSFIISLISILIFYLTSKSINKSGEAEIKILQYALFPILFPYFFLIYTDVLSLLLVTLSFLLIIKNKPILSAITSTASIAVRQTNIIWLVFVFLLPYIQKNNLLISKETIKEHLKKYWPFLISLVIFTIFVILNNGIALGDKAKHPVSLSLGNIYFFLFLFFFLFLPFNISNLLKIIRSLKQNKKIISIIPIVLGVLIIYLLTFNPSHPYNQDIYNFWLRNRILLYFASSLFLKLLFFIPIALSIFSLVITKLHKKSFYLLYPFIILLLLPSWLIEQRYYLIPFAFFILFKKQNSKFIEYTTISIYLVLSIILLYGIKNLKFFL